MTELEQDFMKASKYGDVYTVKKCIDNNVNINIQDDECDTALMEACRCMQTETALFLIKKGANIHIINKKYGYTALILSSSCGATRIVDTLLKLDVDINIQDYLRDTALTWACMNGRLKTVELLVQQELLDVNIRNNNGLNAFDIAYKDSRQYPLSAQILELLENFDKNQKLEKAILKLDDCKFSI